MKLFKNLFDYETKELKKIKKKVIKEIKKEDIINPKTLFYVHKFIDSSFNKKALNIEGRFLEKQKLQL